LSAHPGKHPIAAVRRARSASHVQIFQRKRGSYQLINKGLDGLCVSSTQVGHSDISGLLVTSAHSSNGLQTRPWASGVRFSKLSICPLANLGGGAQFGPSQARASISRYCHQGNQRLNPSPKPRSVPKRDEAKATHTVGWSAPSRRRASAPSSEASLIVIAT
jgi:hypothetical protein